MSASGGFQPAPARDKAVGDLGRLIGIARRDARRAPMEELKSATITTEAGLVGDHKGRRFGNRAITVLSLEQWDEALAEIDALAGTHPGVGWTARRANLLVEGVRLPRARGALLSIGPVDLEMTYPTQPCRRMEEACPGLLKALHPEWRGGITARVLAGGAIKLGDPVVITHRPPEKTIRLPR